MAVYRMADLGKLADRIIGKSEIVSRAAADTINKTATFSIKASIDAIIKEVNLQPSYIKSHIKTTARAKYDNLVAIVSANERGTLLTRYPHANTTTGYRVSVNRTGGFREIKNARLMTLRGSGSKAIGLRNKDAVEYFQKALGKGKRTSKKSRKLQRIIAKARRKPYGMTALHSRSINQLFTSVRTDIQPELTAFMFKTFHEDFTRLDK